jgi:lysophospholipase L1-like esterase
MSKRWLLVPPAVIVARALRVRLSVSGRRRYWVARSSSASRDGGDLLLVALGDSLTQGIGSSRPARSWLGRYLEHLEGATGRVVRAENRAVYGARVADVIRDQLPLPVLLDRVVLCIGANDAGRTAPDDFRVSLRQVCAQLPAGSIVGDVPEFQWGPRTKAAADLSQIVREVVAEFPQLRLAEVERHTIGTKILTELAGDFFHPGDRGYARIARAFIDADQRERNPSADRARLISLCASTHR